MSIPPPGRDSQLPDSHRSVELRLRAAVESSPSGLLMVDREGHVVLVNQQIERMFGYSREELLGRSVDILVPERFRAQHTAARTAFLADPQVRSMGSGRDLFGLRKDGSEVPVEIGLTPVATEDGMFILSSVVDISSRVRAEERFRIAVEASPSGIIMVDEHGVIVLVNRETERLFGYAREELLGRPIETVVPLRYHASHPDSRMEFMKNPSRRRMGAGRELHGLRKDGVEVPVEIGLNPIHTEDGTFVLSAIVDISERKRAQAEQTQLEGQLRQAQKMEAIGTLAGGIAHDFNNVLGAIVGYAELARVEIRDPKVSADLDSLLEVAEHGRQVVKRILDFSRRQDGQLRPTDLGPLLEDARRMLRATLPATIQVELEIAPGLPQVMADPTGIHQVLLNLTNNAAQAMPAGGRLRLAAAAEYLHDRRVREHPGLREGMHVRLTVQDDGLGMTREIQERAFEPFFTTKQPGQGSGLGLAMVHRIVLDHAGAVDLHSEPGRGTAVTCWFPSIALDPDAVAAPPAPATPRGAGQHLLLLDDEPALVRVGERLLTALGYRVTSCTDPERALAMVLEDPHAFDLLISDYTMPRLGGLELAGRVHALAPALPIVLMTGYIEDLEVGELETLGVRRLLRKPVTRQQFAEVLAELLPRPAAD